MAQGLRACRAHWMDLGPGRATDDGQARVDVFRHDPRGATEPMRRAAESRVSVAGGDFPKNITETLANGGENRHSRHGRRGNNRHGRHGRRGKSTDAANGSERGRAGQGGSVGRISESGARRKVSGSWVGLGQRRGHRLSNQWLTSPPLAQTDPPDGDRIGVIGCGSHFAQCFLSSHRLREQGKLISPAVCR